MHKVAAINTLKVFSGAVSAALAVWALFAFVPAQIIATGLVFVGCAWVVYFYYSYERERLELLGRLNEINSRYK
jgi:hypothetical protein